MCSTAAEYQADLSDVPQVVGRARNLVLILTGVESAPHSALCCKGVVLLPEDILLALSLIGHMLHLDGRGCGWVSRCVAWVPACRQLLDEP